MRSVKMMLALSTFISVAVGAAYTTHGDVAFGMTFFVFSLVFAFGLFEKEKTSFPYGVAHLYVGSMLVLLGTGYRLLSFLVSMLNTLLGERPQSFTLPDAILLVTGAVALLNFFRFRAVLLEDEHETTDKRE